MPFEQMCSTYNVGYHDENDHDDDHGDDAGDNDDDDDDDDNDNDDDRPRSQTCCKNQVGCLHSG